MLQNKILWRETCNLWPSLRQMVWMIIPKRFSSGTRSIARANIYGAFNLTQLHRTKMDTGKPSNIEYSSCLPPLKMGLNIQGCGPLSWRLEDKENLINGTTGVKILWCDGKHMAFSTVQPKTWQGLPRSTASDAPLCACGLCQLETRAVLSAHFSPSRETGSAVGLRTDSHKWTSPGSQAINNSVCGKWLKATYWMEGIGEFVIHLFKQLSLDGVLTRKMALLSSSTEAS